MNETDVEASGWLGLDWSRWGSLGPEDVGSKTEYMTRFLDAEGYDYAIPLNDDGA